jgi:hypothetical protein
MLQQMCGAASTACNGWYIHAETGSSSRLSVRVQRAWGVVLLQEVVLCFGLRGRPPPLVCLGTQFLAVGW